MNCIVKIGTLRKNLKQLEYPFALMVKANAYGHGLGFIKKTQDLVFAYGVATEQEGIKLRSLTEKPILITAPDIKMSAMYEMYGLTPMISTPLQLLAINENSKGCVKAHLKVDSGMGRFGCKTLKETKSMIVLADKLNRVKISGICTHFSSLTTAETQMRIFDRHIDLAERFTGRLLRHAAASGTRGVDKYDFRRIGYTAYADVMKVTSEIASVKTLKKGERAGYNGVYQATKKTDIAVVYGGYADGIPRNALGYNVKIRGKNHKIVAVCMDIFIVELSCKCSVGDQVTIVGGQNSIEKLAEISGRIPYEIYVGFGGRCKFIYEE